MYDEDFAPGLKVIEATFKCPLFDQNLLNSTRDARPGAKEYLDESCRAAGVTLGSPAHAQTDGHVLLSADNLRPDKCASATREPAHACVSRASGSPLDARACATLVGFMDALRQERATGGARSRVDTSHGSHDEQVLLPL